ncbi:Gfo/Idh/MocA family oxidoreductase [Labilibacter sediminis]|nr:Gfo/Idh/MocA family oxidoreductase [Labilibacter sediminis]
MGESRRDFLRKIAIAGAGAAMVANPFGQAFAAGGNKKVRIAVIGTGGRGRLLLEHLLIIIKEGGNCEISAICDNYQPSLDMAVKLCVKYKSKVNTFSDYRKLLKDNVPDGVVIATPLHQHAHITIDSMNAGIHVLVEKSMARTLDDVKAMYDVHKQTGSVLMVGHQRLFSKRYLNAMDRIHKGELGEIGQVRAYWHRNKNWRRKVPKDKPELERQINWRLYKEYSAGLLTELMSHQLQVANWALEQVPVSVTGTGSIRYWNDGREVNDNIAAIFSYADGTQFIYDSMTSNKKYGCEEQIMGHKATMELETNKLILEKPPKPKPAPGIAQLISDIKKDTFQSIPVGGASWAPETALKYNGEPIYNSQKGDGTKEELLGFVDCIRQGKNIDWVTAEGYNTSIWSLLTEQAIDTGQKLTMPEKYII